MHDHPPMIDDAEVTLAFYGSIVYLAVVSSLGSQHEPPSPVAAIGAVVATATVLFIAHVFAALVPKAARAGRLHLADLGAVFRHDLPLIVTVVVPVIPLAAASWGVVEPDTGYRWSVRITIAMLFALAVTLSRRDGLGWGRASSAGIVIVAVTIVVIYLESHVH